MRLKTQPQHHIIPTVPRKKKRGNGKKRKTDKGENKETKEIENFTKARSRRREENPDRLSDPMLSVLHAMHSNRLFPNPFIVMYIPPHVES